MRNAFKTDANSIFLPGIKEILLRRRYGIKKRTGMANLKNVTVADGRFRYLIKDPADPHIDAAIIMLI